MEGTPAQYLGRFVNKNSFRAFIYGANGEKKLVNSWDDYEAHMQTGIWFAEAPKEGVTAVAMEEAVSAVAPKKKKAEKSTVTEVKGQVSSPPVKDDFLSEAK